MIYTDFDKRNLDLPLNKIDTNSTGRNIVVLMLPNEQFPHKWI